MAMGSQVQVIFNAQSSQATGTQIGQKKSNNQGKQAKKCRLKEEKDKPTVVMKTCLNRKKTTGSFFNFLQDELGSLHK